MNGETKMEGDQLPATTRNFVVSGMPMSQYLAWKNKCINDFGDCYWMKIWADHKFKEDYEKFYKEMKEELDELKIEIKMLKATSEDKVKESTFRGN
jgi:hypothetical protein